MLHGPLNQLKYNARELMRTALPSTAMVTLVYLLLTHWVRLAASFVFPSPISAATEQVAQMVKDPTDFSAVYAAMPAAFRAVLSGNSAQIALFVTIALFLYTLVMEFGYDRYCLNLTRGEQCGYAALFSQFEIAGKVVLLQVVIFVVVYFWSMFLIIPGLLMWYCYRMAAFWLVEHPDQSSFRALAASQTMMKGHKLELLTLDLSFLGWMALSIVLSECSYYLFFAASQNDMVSNVASAAVSTTIALFVTPYMTLTYAGYYHRLAESMPEPAKPM